MSDAAGQVWWLYGPPSVGKSATAWQLFTQVLAGEPRGYFDIDQVGMCSPEPADDPGRYALKARAAVRVVRRFTAAGVRTVIISGVADERSLSTFVDEVDGAEVTFCRLRVDPEELKRRLSTRYGPNDTARALAEADRWDRYDSAGLLVDTGEGDPLDTARRVAEAVRSAAAPAPVTASGPPSSSAQAAAGADPGRAVLICGPAGVGKSTVGFGLFGNLQGDGRAAAYLDLQQLGFLADLPQGAPGGHEIVAGCVADLWEEYRAVGAQDLVLTGNVEQVADVQRYRDALGATPLVVCRLRTTPEALRDRIMARTRGGGPMLAGDALLGLTADKAEIVFHEALTQQSRLDTEDPADVTLETADRSPEAVTQSARAAIDRLTSVGPRDSVTDVLALYGSPGAGKSTLARALALTLAQADIPWGVIDMDQLSAIHPYPGRFFPRENLRLIWPNYVAAVPNIKLIIPTVFADEGEVELLRAVLPGARLIICELTAPIEVLKQRVTEREPTEEMAVGLRRWVDVYHARSDHERIRDFQVTTYPAAVRDSVHEILQLAGWV